MSESNRYVMADAATEPESVRLQLLERWHDPSTTRRLDRLGVDRGWRCLEVGAGCGSIARWLAGRVGAEGSVVAADIDPRFLKELPRNVEVRRLDIRSDEVGVGRYDLVHCRFLLMHLPEPEAALRRMVAALRPGGVLLAEEGDHGLFHFAGHPEAAALNLANGRTLQAMRQAGVMNPWFGRELPGLLPALGLEQGWAETETPVTGPGEPEYEWTRATLLDAGARLVGAGIAEPSWLELCRNYFGRPGTVLSSMSVVAAGARKPAERHFAPT